MKDFNKIFEKIENNKEVSVSLVEETLKHFITIEDYKKCIIIQNYIEYRLNNKSGESFSKEEYVMIREIDELNKEIIWLDNEFEKSKQGKNKHQVGLPGDKLFELHEMMYNTLRSDVNKKIDIIKLNLDGTFDPVKEKIKSEKNLQDFLNKSKKVILSDLNRRETNIFIRINKNKKHLEILIINREKKYENEIVQNVMKESFNLSIKKVKKILNTLEKDLDDIKKTRENIL